jgi:hypothetical protein
MKRLAMAVSLLLVALGAQAEPAGLPKPISLVNRHKASNITHFVRGADQKLPKAAGLESRDTQREPRKSHGVREK